MAGFRLELRIDHDGEFREPRCVFEIVAGRNCDRERALQVEPH
jgi:hypothetical protein